MQIALRPQLPQALKVDIMTPQTKSVQSEIGGVEPGPKRLMLSSEVQLH